MRWIIWLFVGLIVIGGGIVGFIWYQNYTAQGLLLSFDAPEAVQVGVPFEISVDIKNDSNTDLSDGRLALRLPESMIFVETGLETLVKEIGSIGQGSEFSEHFQVMVLSGESSLQTISARMSYMPLGIGGVFEQIAYSDIRVSDAGLALELNSPTKVFNGEQFTLEFEYENNSDFDFDAVQVRVLYPEDFQLLSSTLKPSGGDEFFVIGDVKGGEANSFSITGKFNGKDRAFYEFGAEVSAEFGGERFDLFEKGATVAIESAPITLALSLDDDSGAVSAGETLDFSLAYRNNSSETLKDVIASVEFVGEMFDLGSLDSNGGSLSSGIVRWNASAVKKLALLESGAEGTIPFSIDVKEEFPVGAAQDKNFKLSLIAKVESNSVPSEVSSSKVSSQTSFETLVRDTILFRSFGYASEPVADISNSGPFPPVVGEATEFTVHWIFENGTNDMSNVQVRSFLGPNVEFTGESDSTTGVAPEYNDRTQEIFWRVDSIPANAGVVSEPVRAIFQVRLTPGADQKGQVPVLVKQMSVTGTNDFTEEGVRYTVDPISTNVFDRGGAGQVVEN
ncbi:MAG: hypothetical protein R3B52_03605 [Candidatus Paceibacterota bacterium]